MFLLRVGKKHLEKFRERENYALQTGQTIKRRYVPSSFNVR